MAKLLPPLLLTVVIGLAAGVIIYQGLIKQKANLLAFSLALGGLLGWTIGFSMNAPQVGSAIGAVLAPLCVLPVKNFNLTGRSAIAIGTGWILVAVGWIAWIVRDILIR